MESLSPAAAPAPSGEFSEFQGVELAGARAHRGVAGTLVLKDTPWSRRQPLGDRPSRGVSRSTDLTEANDPQTKKQWF